VVPFEKFAGLLPCSQERNAVSYPATDEFPVFKMCVSHSWQVKGYSCPQKSRL